MKSFNQEWKSCIKSGFGGKLGAGVVITGGSSSLQGTDELASKVFKAPVRIAYPSGEKYKGLADAIESPKYSTAVGLALHALSLTKESSENVVIEVEEEKFLLKV